MKIRIFDKFRKCIVDQDSILSIRFSTVDHNPHLLVYAKCKINPYKSVKEENRVYCTEFEIMQSTGLKDINGTKIYERDIVETISEFGNDIAIIRFNGLEFYLEYLDKNLESELLSSIGIDIKVIGNVYE